MLLRRLVIGSSVAALVACASSSNSTPTTTSSSSGSGSSCTEIASAARSVVSEAIDAHLACQHDGDCTSVALSVSGCFDSCSRAVAAANVADVDAAKQKVDGAQCQDFRAKGCSFAAPPCVPPGTPHCTNGVCGE